ncbi:9544_t:CDS:2, partial [Dentiscutata erythropus]
MPKVDNKFKSLEAFEDAAKLAAKANKFAFARKNSSFTGHNGKSPFIILQCTKGKKWSVNKVIDGGIICTKDVVNEHACIRYALNEGSNNDSAQKLLRLFEKHDYIVVPLKTIEDKSKALYIWFLQTLCTKIYNAYNCVSHVFMLDRNQALRNASSKLFKTDDDYEAFKKEVVALRFTILEKQIPQSLNAVKKAAEKAHMSKKLIQNGSAIWEYQLLGDMNHLIVHLKELLRWQFFENPNIVELSCSSKSSIINPEFYSTFIKAEEKFEQLSDNVTKIEFITKLRKITNMLLLEPVKMSQKVVSKDCLPSTKRELLLTEHQNAATKKKKKMLNNINKLKSKPIQQQHIPMKQTLISGSNSKLYEVNIPKFMHEYISVYIDVAKDSNCSFHAIAISIGKPESFWPNIRALIYNKLCNQNKLISLTFLPDNILLNRNVSINFVYVFERQHFIAIKLKPNVSVPSIVRGWED